MNRRNPEPPVNVKVWTADRQRSLALECVYVGWERRSHVWRVVTPFDPEVYVTASIEELPGKTTVQFISAHGDELHISTDEGWGQ